MAVVARGINTGGTKEFYLKRKTEKLNLRLAKNYFLFSIIIFSVFGILQLIQYANLIKAEREIFKLNQEISWYMTENNKLIFKIEKLKSSVETTASKNLQMIRPEKKLKVKIEENSEFVKTNRKEINS